MEPIYFYFLVGYFFIFIAVILLLIGVIRYFESVKKLTYKDIFNYRNAYNEMIKKTKQN